MPKIQSAANIIDADSLHSAAIAIYFSSVHTNNYLEDDDKTAISSCEDLTQGLKRTNQSLL